MKVPVVKSEPMRELEGIDHGFFTRLGGVSKGAFSSLNCSPISGDKSDAIEANRQIVASKLGGRVLVTNRQVHGKNVRVIGPDNELNQIVEADGLITRELGVCIGALGADCAPVLFAEPETMIIGVAHVGWQGGLAGVTDVMLATMKQMGASWDSIYCCIGPAIQRESYEVGGEFKNRLLAESSIDAESCFTVHAESGNVHFDLPLYIEKRLRHRGLKLIDRCDQDTYSDNERFFSYRRACHRGERLYGRQVGAICLLEDA